jgi:PTH1 family peptidyl-tRNA hydrolase
MNLSGKAVRYWLQQLKITEEQLLVITDDLALPTGKLRLRPQGSDGGHNGLKSINELLGNQQYARLRFGVGSDFPKGRQVEYVLGRWKPEEEPIIREKIKLAGEMVLSFGTVGIAATMSRYNNL